MCLCKEDSAESCRLTAADKDEGAPQQKMSFGVWLELQGEWGMGART